MFKNLKMKLTLINLFSVGLILIMVLVGIYIIMDQNIERRADIAMRTFSTMDNGQKKPVPPEFRKYKDNIFYAKTDEMNNIIETSQKLPVDLSGLTKMVELSVPKGFQGFITYDNVTYRFQHVGRKGSYYIFLSTQIEKDLLVQLMGTCIAVGFAALLLVLILSFYVAERALIPIRKSWEEQKNFIADASHELRSPLTVILTNIELVMGNGSETVDSQKRWLSSVKDESLRMSKMVNDMLQLARADANQEVMEKKSFELSKILTNAFDSLEPVAKGKNLIYEISVGADGLILGDQRYINQLITILLDNAIKYTEPGGRVKLLLEATPEEYHITVKDSGIGIPSDQVKKVFERFYRVDKARSRAEDGTGLGLAIADWIVNAHHGSIRVDSILGEGSSFIVVLPKGK